MPTPKWTPLTLFCLIWVALICAGLLIFTQSPARAADQPAVTAVTATAATGSITETVAARVSALLNTAGRGPVSGAMPPGTTLASVSTASDAVTVVLSLPASALYGFQIAPNSDDINMAVINSLDGLPFKAFHVLTTDPHNPTADPLPINAFIPLRPRETKPVDTSIPLTPTAAPSHRPSAFQAFSLTGKAVYVSAGHGWFYNGSGWVTQRPPYQSIVEDMNNAEAVDQYLIAYLRQAGADVFPLRDPSFNTAEVVVPIGSAGYSETGSWLTSPVPGTGYKGETVRYAWGVNGQQATATATWVAPISASGWYPVYAWYPAWVNRLPDAHYEIKHALGTHEVIVNQQVHGFTWRYLGTYYFRAGQPAQVTLLDTSSITSANSLAVIADAIRIGGGMGDVVRGTPPTVSGHPRFEEAARYWTILEGAPLSVYNPCGNSGDACDDVDTRGRYADWENAGRGDDAVFVSWHTNGADGTARGTVSYVYNNDPTPPWNLYHLFPGSTDLQSAVHSRVIQAIHSGWDASWYDRGPSTANLGEVREAQSMPSMLIEMAFHDNAADAAALLQPHFEQLLARAMYQGIVNYYANKAGTAPHYLPEPPERFTLRNAGGGQVTFSWQAPATFAFGTATDPALRYHVYLSDDGFAWDEGHDAAGTTLSLGGYGNNQLLYARVTAVNDGGESFPSPMLAVRVGAAPRALIVHGFDSLDASMSPPFGVGPYAGVPRMFLDRMNRYNYVAQHATAITEAFDSAVHQAVAAGDVLLSTYKFVDWYSGLQSFADGVLNPAERALLSNYSAQSNRVLFISGANIAAQLAVSDSAFLANVLHSGFSIDNVGSYAVNAQSGGLFDGAAGFALDDGNHGTYNAQSNDGLVAGSGAFAALRYGSGQVAASTYASPNGTTIIDLGFPFETVYPASARSAIMVRALALLPPPPSLTPRVWLPIVLNQPQVLVEARAVWISRFDWCSPAPCSQTTLVNLINHAADAHFNIVLFQVRGTADAFYTPGLEPWSYLLTSAQTTTLGTSPGWDPLALAIQTAHARGLQLHAYVNMYSNWDCGKWFPPHTVPEHAFWTLGNYPSPYLSTWRVYSTTASGPTPMSVLTTAPVPCSEYLWSSPGVQRVNDENLAVIKNIVTRYNVDGVHMDRVRYPGPQFSTDPESLAAYAAVSNTISYGDWQRDVLSRWMTRIYTEVKAIKPQVKLSAAVWFTYKITPAITFPTSQGFYDYYQDSHRWITEGSVDAIAPFIYGGTFDSDIVKWKALADDHVAVQGARQVWLGVGGAITPFAGINDRIQYARSIGARGVSLWSAGALETNGYWISLLAGPFKDVAIVP